ncbi:hypothetical protein BFJ71_g16991 [Fusarium oxysporum]|nr:hypothetical protein BFJ71_g16991 [Fusarium oxysporum]
METWEKEPEEHGGAKRKREVLCGAINSCSEEVFDDEPETVSNKHSPN